MGATNQGSYARNFSTSLNSNSTSADSPKNSEEDEGEDGSTCNPLVKVLAPRLRSFAVLKITVKDDTIQQTASTKQEALLRAREQSEVFGKLSRTPHSEPDRIICTEPPPAKSPNVNYMPRQMAPLLVPWVRKCLKKGKDLSSDDARTHLDPYMFRDADMLDINCVRRAISEAKALADGAREEQAQLMQSLATAFGEVGHNVVVHSTTKAAQVNILLEKAKKEHTKEVENLPAGKRPRFKAPPALYKPVAHLKEDSNVLYGYDWLPEHGPRMIGSLRHIYSCDAAHMKNKFGGTVFSTWGVDAPDQLVCLGLSLYYDTESEDTWTRHISALKAQYPGMDADDAALLLMAIRDLQNRSWNCSNMHRSFYAAAPHSCSFLFVRWV